MIREKVIISLSVILMLSIGLMVGGIGAIYEMNFGMRYDSAQQFQAEAELTNHLNVTNVSFHSTKGEDLAEVIYESQSDCAWNGGRSCELFDGD